MRELDDSFYCRGLPNRRRFVLLNAILAAAFTLSLLVWGASRTVLTATFLAYVLLFSLEKLSYVRNQRLSRTVMQKLVRRIEELEGVPMTPDDAPPNRTGRIAA